MTQKLFIYKNYHLPIHQFVQTNCETNLQYFSAPRDFPLFQHESGSLFTEQEFDIKIGVSMVTE